MNRQIGTIFENGIEIAVVPLGKHGQHGKAYLELSRYKFLTEELGLSGNWTQVRGHVCSHCPRQPGKLAMVGRVLLNTGPGQTVAYRDGDKSNLRTSNLRVIPSGKAKSRAWDALSKLAA